MSFVRAARWPGVCVVFIGFALAWGQVSQGQTPVETDTAQARGDATGKQDIEQAAALERRVQHVIAECNASVVSVYRYAKERKGTGESSPIDAQQPPLGFGSGVIIDSHGLILTNLHVLGEWQSSSYLVWYSGKPYRAELKAGDPWLDLAVLKIAGEEFPAVKIGNADTLSKGAFVVALGNLSGAAKDGTPSASFGVISNFHRSAPSRSVEKSNLGDAPSEELPSDGRATLHHYGTLLQTTASLELGSSGGLLVNMRSEMVGLTVSLGAVLGHERSGGYAIPVDETFLRSVELLKSGRQPSYGFLGVAPAELRSDKSKADRRGAQVANVVPGTPASAAGIKVDDIITEVDGKPIANDVELIRNINGKAAGATVELTLAARDAGGNRIEARKAKVTLGKRPADPLRPGFAEVPTPVWRGLKVDYATACPNFQQASRSLEGKLAVGVIEVLPNSLAWQAGIRPGDFLVQALGKPCGSPEQFLQIVAAEAGPVQLTLLGSESSGAKDSLQRTVAAGPSP